jgi:hypothetical protein
MGWITRFGVFCLVGSLALLLLASGGGITGPALGLPAVASCLLLGAGLALDRRARRTRRSLRAATNWAEDFTARVRSERAAAREGSDALPVE